MGDPLSGALPVADFHVHTIHSDGQLAPAELARRAAQNPGSLSRVEWDTWYCTAYISSTAYQIEEILPMVRVKPILRVAQGEGAILEKTQLMIIILTVLTLLCSALAISNLVTANIMERSVEIGLMKALGATGLAIAALVLAEILAASFLGGIAGYLVGLGLAQLIGWTVFGAAVSVKLVVIPIGALMVLAVSLLGSLPALRALLGLRPTEVLHGR
jgi:putative ABC transport system permease protein